MSSNLERYEGRKARWEIRGALVHALTVFAAGTVLFLAYGLGSLGSLDGWRYLAASVAFGVLGLGLYRGRAWARVPAMVFLILVCVAGVIALAKSELDALTAWRALCVAASAWTAWYLSRPSTRELFRTATQHGDAAS